MPFENHGHEPLPPTNLIARHPKGIGARVLLTSVFGPYARDDEFGSRHINPMRTASSGLLWAMQQRMKKTNPVISAVISSRRRDIGDEFGPFRRVAGGLLGPFLLWTARREERRLGNGVTYEPNPIVDRRNWVPTGSRPAMHGLPQGAGIPFPVTEPR